MVLVRYFAQLREARGRSEEHAELPADCTAAEAYAALALPPGLPVAFAVNAVRVPGSTRLSGGDELVFLPPLGGG